MLATSAAVVYLAYLPCFTLALAGQHQVRARKTAPALFVALIVASIALAPLRLSRREVIGTVINPQGKVLIGIGK